MPYTVHARNKSPLAVSHIMNMPKKQHIGIDKWKMDQIRNLHRCGFSINEIADQVDANVSIVKEVLELLGNGS